MGKGKTPRIRFKGFTDDWEQRKLGEIADHVIEKNLSLVEHETFTNSAEFGIVSQMDFFDHGITNEENIGNYYIVHPEDFVYNPRISVTAPVGPINRNKLGRNGVMSPLYTVFRPHDIDNTYLEYYFKADGWHSFMRFNGDTGARSDRFSIKTELFYEMPILIPKLEEQNAIGRFLRNLSEHIALHQRKLDKLKIIKKFMIENMFPKNGEKRPRIRFSGFTDDWEQRKFGELYRKSSEKNDGSRGMDKNITVATMQYKDDVKVSTEEYLRTYYTFNIGDIAFEGHQSKDFRFGRFVENDIGNGIVSHIFPVFRPIVAYDLFFWKYAINNENLMQIILSRSTKASTMMHDLVTNDFLQESFCIPCLDEQRKIGSYLNGLDNLIALHQRKLDKMKKIKQSMLEKMFV